MPSSLKKFLGFLIHPKVPAVMSLLVILAAIPLTVMMARQQQEVRQRAAGGSTSQPPQVNGLALCDLVLRDAIKGGDWEYANSHTYIGTAEKSGENAGCWTGDVNMPNAAAVGDVWAIKWGQLTGDKCVLNPGGYQLDTSKATGGFYLFDVLVVDDTFSITCSNATGQEDTKSMKVYAVDPGHAWESGGVDARLCVPRVNPSLDHNKCTKSFAMVRPGEPVVMSWKADWATSCIVASRGVSPVLNKVVPPTGKYEFVPQLTNGAITASFDGPEIGQYWGQSRVTCYTDSSLRDYKSTHFTITYHNLQNELVASSPTGGAQPSPTGTGTGTGTGTCNLVGDVNKDCVRSILDYNILMSCWLGKDGGKACGNLRENADLNSDGKVNEVDYNIFLKAYAEYKGE